MVTVMRVVVVATLGGLAACRTAEPSRASLPAAAAGTSGPVVDVSTVPVTRGPILQPVIASGSVVALRESHIGTEVPGRVQEVYVAEGDRVTAGAPLFQIDPVPYEMAVRQAEAGLDVARAERSQLESDLARGRALRKQEVVSQQDFDRMTTQLAVAQAHERQLNEALALARYNLSRTIVRAPYDGSVAKRLVDEGTTALVQPQTIVIVLQETDILEADAAIPESQLALVQLGDRGLLRVEGIPDPIETTVSSVNDSIDPATRTYLVKLRVPNQDRRLKAGVFALVEITPASKVDVLLVPADAVRTEDGRTRVMVVRDERAVAVPVEIGLTSETSAEVTRGVNLGDPVIVGEAARAIAPGMRVRVTEAGRGPAS